MDNALFGYEKLKQDIAAIKQAAQTAVNTILITSYWRIGERLALDTSVKNNEEWLLAKLACDIEIERTLIGRCLLFYRVFPDACPAGQYPSLSWSHYRHLLPLKNGAFRQQILDAAVTNHWTVRFLAEKIKQTRADITQSTTISSSGSTGTQLTRRRKKLHLYAATVTRIVDGDTLIVDIDLGFDVWTKRRIRLRGIDCAEKKTDAGQVATAFAAKKLPIGSRIVLQTFTTDLHGRYVADVFYMTNETDKETIAETGNFLNQELLNAGLAVVM